ncbi:MAG: hypothetical protein HOE48_15120 [Candidatus Latescibacteria bacterium]|jgi:hypothetical protein|nr:hypothetical protein [Candidatus Latescibacterota bacterium]MBT5831164.1 hypothetical protein [Candidatus Latescibacterota bacterium]
MTHRHPTPVISADKPWELDNMLISITVLPDPTADRLRLYYFVRTKDNPTQNLLCVAYSSDGYHWTKPDLGDGTNIVMRASGNETGWGQFMPTRILFDPNDPDTSQHWKMIYWDRPNPNAPSGICLATSPDGFTWTTLPNQPVMCNANDAMSMINVPHTIENPIRGGRYLIYQQTWTYNPHLPTERDNLKGIHRHISLWSSPTFASHIADGGWIGPITILEPDVHDPPDIQFYWLTPFLTPKGFGGLLNCHHTNDQTMDVQLVTSTDGWSWERANNREPIIPLTGPGHFDCGLIVAASPPVLWQNKALVYYNGRATVHDQQLRYPDHPAPNPLNGIGLAEFDTATLLT